MALYFGGTSLLLHGDGADGSTVFVDETGKAVTAYGNAHISTAQSKFGGASMYFGGIWDYLAVPDSVDFNLNSADFTLEAWVFNTQATGNYPAILGQWGGPSYSFILYVANNGTFDCQFGVPNVARLTTAITYTQNTWQHIAVTRQGSVFTLWVDGISRATTSYSGAIPNSTVPLYIGHQHDAIAYGSQVWGWVGYMDEVRILKGAALYTTNFTPPSSPLGIIPRIQIGIQPHTIGNFAAGNYNPVQGKPKEAIISTDLTDRAPYGMPNSLTAGLANPFEFKGRGRITGTVAEKALPANTPLRRKVMLHRLPEGLFVAATWSDAVTGEYTFDHIKPECKYTVTSYDHTGTYRAVIADNLVPTPL